MKYTCILFYASIFALSTPPLDESLLVWITLSSILLYLRKLDTVYIAGIMDKYRRRIVQEYYSSWESITTKKGKRTSGDRSSHSRSYLSRRHPTASRKPENIWIGTRRDVGIPCFSSSTFSAPLPPPFLHCALLNLNKPFPISRFLSKLSGAFSYIIIAFEIWEPDLVTKFLETCPRVQNHTNFLSASVRSRRRGV